MKIETSRFEYFVKSKEYLKFAAVLICGQDYGAISNSLKSLEKAISPNDDPFTTAKIDASQITEDSTIILDELSAISFGGGRRLVIIKNLEGKEANQAVIKALENISPEIIENAILIVTAGDLSKDSSLKKFFESEKYLASFQYYAENERALATKIIQTFRESQISITPEAADTLAELCKGDAGIMQNEVKKIALCTGKGANLGVEDIYNLTGNSSETSVQDIANQIFLGNFSGALEKYRKAKLDGVVPIFLFRSLKNYLEKLEYAREQTKKGKNLSDVTKFMRIFYSQQEYFRKHIQNLAKYDDLSEFHHMLYEAEAEIKTSNSEPEIITEQLIYKLAGN